MGRPRLGRGAFEPRARGDENQGGRNDFLRFQEQLLRRKKRELFLGVSVGNGVRGGITLHKIGGGSAIKVNFIALTLHYLCPKKHHCEAQINQIRIKGYPYYLYFDEFLNIFTISATPYYVRIMTYAVGLCKKWVVST